MTLSQEKTEADSGLGRTGSGYCLSNSCSQREELGDEQTSTSRPSPKSTVTGSRKTVKHASFKDDKKVLLFGSSSDSDVPDKNEKRRVSTDKKPEPSKDKDENSAKRKSAEQSEKTRKSSRKQAASSEKVSKEERDRSASKERPRRSRSSSRRRRASRLRSAGSTGGKKRESTSKKVKKRERKDDTVVPETSSEDSSSESDNDESSRANIESRSKHVLKPPKFDCKSSFETFWAQFENCASHNQWSRAQQLVYLKNALETDAANVLWDYGKEVIDSLTGLTKTLKMRFGGENSAVCRERPARKPCCRRETAQCHCKIRYVSKSKAASRGSPCDSTAFLFLVGAATSRKTFLFLKEGRFGHSRSSTVDKFGANGKCVPCMRLPISP